MERPGQHYSVDPRRVLFLNCQICLYLRYRFVRTHPCTRKNGISSHLDQSHANKIIHHITFVYCSLIDRGHHSTEIILVNISLPSWLSNSLVSQSCKMNYKLSSHLHEQHIKLQCQTGSWYTHQILNVIYWFEINTKQKQYKCKLILGHQISIRDILSYELDVVIYST